MPPFCGTAGGVGRGSILSQATDKIPTYVVGLDDRLSGGIPRGHIVLVAGPPGSLKSSFVYRILFHEAKEHGASGLYLSMEQSRTSLISQMTSLGMDPGYAKGVHIIDVRALRREIEEVREQPRWLLGLRRQLARYKEEMGCDLIALDSLDALYALAPFESPRNEIFQFFEELRDLNATTFLVSEMPRDTTQFAHFGVEEFLSDTIIHLRLREVDVGMSTSASWDLGEVVQRSLAPGTSPDVLFFWARVTWVAIAFVPATLYQLALTYPTKADWIRRPWALAAIYLPALVWASLISMTGLVINGMSSNAFGFAVVRYGYLGTGPVTEARTGRAPRHRLERGLNYLVLENGRSSAMGAFRDIVSATPGLCVTGLAPSRVSVRFGLERTPILWITTVSNEERTVRPNALDFELVHTVVKFLRENPGTAVLLDDLDYLATLAGFDAVARFLKRVTNQASASKGTVIVAAGFGTFPPEQVALLRGSVDRVLEVHEAIASSTPGAQHVP